MARRNCALSLSFCLILLASARAVAEMPTAATPIPAPLIQEPPFTPSVLRHWALKRQAIRNRLTGAAFGGFSAFDFAQFPGTNDWVPTEEFIAFGSGNSQQAKSIDANSIFQEPALYNIPGGVSAVAVADVNGDGRPDLLIATPKRWNKENSPGGVTVMLGNGDGTYQKPQAFVAGGYDTDAIAVADVNGDGKLDIVVANFSKNDRPPGGTFTGGVGVLLGNGDGTFQPAQSYSSGGYYANAIAIADINGDGKPDLIVVNECLTAANCPSGTSGGVSVLIGKGDGTFQAAQRYSSGSSGAFDLRVRDLNGDGNPDVVVVNACDECANGEIGILLGNGDGSFQEAITYNSGGEGPISFDLSDIDGDGKIDMVVSNACFEQCTGEGAGDLAVFLGNGDGTFRTPNIYQSNQYSGYLALADVNGDGKPDLLLASERVDMLVMLGQGDGTFLAPNSYEAGDGGPFYFAVFDVNGDGRPDIVSTSECATAFVCSSGGVETILGNGDGSFLTSQNYAVPQTVLIEGVATADVDGDGNLDLVVSAQPESGGQDGVVAVLAGKGDGTFHPLQSYDVGGVGSGAVAVADINGDGKPDVLVATTLNGGFEGAVAVLLGNGDGTFQTATSYDSGGFPVTSLAVADVNGDGNPDLVVANYCAVDGQCFFGNPYDGSVGVMLGNGDGTFQPVKIYDSGGLYASSISVGDLNGDGKPDLIVVNQCMSQVICRGDGAVTVLLGNGDGTFQAGSTFDSGGYSPTGLALANLSHDGKLDLVVANNCTSYSNCNSPGSAGLLAIFKGTGDGTFQAPLTMQTPGTIFGSLAVADYNGDGKLDLAIGNGAVLFLGKGDGTFQAPTDLGAGGAGIAVGDFNRDGKPDLVVGDTVLLNGAVPRRPSSPATQSTTKMSMTWMNMTWLNVR